MILWYPASKFMNVFKIESTHFVANRGRLNIIFYHVFDAMIVHYSASIVN